MNFKNWFIENDIKYGGFANDGTIFVYINGKRYVYRTDPVYHYNWKKRIKYQPWKVLHQIKDMVQSGKAIREV